MNTSVHSGIVQRSGSLESYQVVQLIIDTTVEAAWGFLEERQKCDSSEILELFVNEVFEKDIDIMHMESDELKDDNNSVDEADIEKRIKDLRKISENQINCNEVMKTEIDYHEDLERDVSYYINVSTTFDDFVDEPLKRKCSGIRGKRAHNGQSYLKYIDDTPTPVIKMARCSESCSSIADVPLTLHDLDLLAGTSPPLSSSTPTMLASIPWSVTETAPPVFWTSTRSHIKTVETSGNNLDAIEGSGASCEEELSFSFSDEREEIEENLDLREVLRRKKEKLPSSKNDASRSIVGIDKIKVTVSKDLENRRVVETDLVEEVKTQENEIELEEGEIFESTDINFNMYKEVNSKYDKSLLGDLLRKKKVLEHLIDMVSKEENGEEFEDVSEEHGSSEEHISLSESEDYEEYPKVTDASEESSTRKVIYRSSSPFSQSVESQPVRIISNDLNSEMKKSMENLFPGQLKLSDPQSVIKVEPISEDDDITLSDAETNESVREQVTTDFEIKVKSTSRSSKDSEKFHCSLCNVIVMSQRSMNEHIKGKKHRHNSCYIIEHKISNSRDPCKPNVLDINKNVTQAPKSTTCASKELQGGFSDIRDLGKKILSSGRVENNMDKCELGNSEKVCVSESDLGIQEFSEVKKPSKRKRIIWDLK